MQRSPIHIAADILIFQARLAILALVTYQRCKHAMKPHPASIILIEKVNRLWWRIAERATTQTGLSKQFIIAHKETFPRWDVARHEFDRLRHKPVFKEPVP